MGKRNVAEGGRSGHRSLENQVETRKKLVSQIRKETGTVGEYLLGIRFKLSHLQGRKLVAVPPPEKPGRKPEKFITFDQNELINEIVVAQKAGDALYTSLSDEDIGMNLWKLSEAVRKIREHGSELFPGISLPPLNKKQLQQWKNIPKWAEHFLPAGELQRARREVAPMPQHSEESDPAPLAESVERTVDAENTPSSDLLTEEFFEKPRTSAQSKEEINYRMAIAEMQRTREAHLACFKAAMHPPTGAHEADRARLNKEAEIAVGHYRTAFMRLLTEIERKDGPEAAAEARLALMKDCTFRENELIALPKLMSTRAEEAPKRKHSGTAFLAYVAALGIPAGGLVVATHFLTSRATSEAFVPPSPRTPLSELDTPILTIPEHQSDSRRPLSGIIASAMETRAATRAAMPASSPAPVIPAEIDAGEPVTILETATSEPMVELDTALERLPLMAEEGIGGEVTLPIEPDASTPSQQP